MPLTSYPGNEIGGSFSPDGSQVAFAWRREGREDFDIYVKLVGSDKALQLTNTPEWDIGPAWSPGGREIAFFRSRREGGNGIYTVSPLGGPERLVVELGGKGAAYWWPGASFAGAQLSWSPDGTWLAYGGVWLASPATGEKRRLTTPPDGLRDSHPAFSPDGHWVAFARSSNPGVEDLYAVATAGGEPRRLATVGEAIFGLCWTADGQEIVYSSAQDNWADSKLWRVPVSGGSPRRPAGGGENAWFPSISQRGSRLAVTRRLFDINVWQVEAPGAGGVHRPPARFIASTRTDGAPRFSPDGRRVAFVSDRSGSMQLWICNPDGSDPVQMTLIGAGPPAWSPDGRHIAFDARVGGNTNVYVIAAQGGAPRQLTRDIALEGAPSWSRDGRWLYFTSDRSGRFEIWKMPAEGGRAVQVTRNGGHRAVESPDGKFVWYNRSQDIFDAWKLPVEGGKETPVLTNLRSRWTLSEDGLYFFEREERGKLAGAWFLKFFDFATGRRRPVAALTGMPLLGQAPTISPDGRTLLYTQWDSGEADLVLFEDFR